ncbi:MAG TPA: PadR family transcriptional regulator [Gemmatimonadales bacterium]|nr:PadR family transcriptional regulator [Gemmatimonadales bacterium]
MADSLQLLRGTLDILILKTLAGSRLHGYAIASRIAARTRGALAIEDGALYQSLHRMAERGWVEAEWGHGETGKRARFYQLTEAGRRQLRVETANWLRYAEAVFRVLQPDAA